MRQFAQYAALPYVVLPGRVDVCLLTSRDTGRWIIPKGWPKRRLTPFQLAEREAREEGGLVGAISTTPIGTYTYRKKLHILAHVQCRVDVFPMLVDQQKLKWPEAGQRELSWFPHDVASQKVNESDLANLIAMLPDWLTAQAAA